MDSDFNDVPLTAHFNLREFQKGDPIPAACIPIFTELAEKILEPVREEFGQVLIITSGYRSPNQNAAAHGQPNSEHLATTWMCACDFYIEGVPSRSIFDWMRSSQTLPYHQLILETNPVGGSIIHVSMNRTMKGIRSVLLGATHNTEPYVKVDHTAYLPPSEDLKNG